MTETGRSRTTRRAAVAGMFYPASAVELAQQVDGFLGNVPKPESYVRAIVAPHAGYVYSGQIAAIAHAQLDPETKRVVVLGPTHRVGIAGMALSGADEHETPLGPIREDIDLSQEIAALPGIITAPVVHAQEHSIEVQLPFLQRHLNGEFTVVPVAVGAVEPELVANVIETAWQFPHTAVVVSSDLSHYLPYGEANAVDQSTLAQVLRCNPALTGQQACGAYPLSGLMYFARETGLEGRVLASCNSGDTAGDHDRVVGYAAITWQERTEQQSQALPRIAYNAIAGRLGVGQLDVEGISNSESVGASFVTLTLEGDLRGCIGSLEAHRPLIDDVKANAQAAAFEDPRFQPLTAAELEQVEVEVSVLSPPKPLPGGLSEDQVIEALTPGVDGVVLRYGPYRATYLPQVWDQLPDPRTFLATLKNKAGLPSDFWAPEMQVETYRVSSVYLRR